MYVYYVCMYMYAIAHEYYEVFKGCLRRGFSYVFVDWSFYLHLIIGAKYAIHFQRWFEKIFVIFRMILWAYRGSWKINLCYDSFYQTNSGKSFFLLCTNTSIIYIFVDYLCLLYILNWNKYNTKTVNAK